MTKVFGYAACRTCGDAILDIVAAKTRTLCPTCFSAATNPFLGEVTAHFKSGERIRLSVVSRKRSSGHKAAKRRTRGQPDARVHRARVRRATTRALARLRDLYPDVYEVLLADERAKLGLEAWTIERALTPHRPFETFNDLAKYCGVDAPAFDDGDPP